MRTESLRVMTYNTHHGAGYDDSSEDHAMDLERTARVVLSEAPDIIALQEVDRFWARSGRVDQPKELSRLLKMDACFGANMRDEIDNREYGVVTLSAFPILSSQNIPLPGAEGWEQRGMLDTRVDIPGLGEVAILNAHLQSNASGRSEDARHQRKLQSAAIAQHLDTLNVPIVLMGDFNAEVESGDIDAIIGSGSRLNDVWSAVGVGAGLSRPASPAKEPVERIDLILISAEFAASTARVMNTEVSRMASDHYPVVADLTIAG